MPHYDLRPYQRPGPNARAILPPDFAPSGSPPTLAPAAPVPEELRAAVLSCPHAGPTPERFGRSCACDRLCHRDQAAPRVVVFRNCLDCMRPPA